VKEFLKENPALADEIERLIREQAVVNAPVAAVAEEGEGGEDGLFDEEE
jgi:hypothetical protein